MQSEYFPVTKFLETLPTRPANEIEAARLEAWLMFQISRRANRESAQKYWGAIACIIEAMPRLMNHAFESTEGFPEDCVTCSGPVGIHLVKGAA